MIAAVAAGLWVSWHGRGLIRPETRLQGFFIWGLVTWTVEALVFLLTGLQAARLAEALDRLGRYPSAADDLAARRAVADRLAQPADDWQPFRPPPGLARLFPGEPGPV